MPRRPQAQVCEERVEQFVWHDREQAFDELRILLMIHNVALVLHSDVRVVEQEMGALYLSVYKIETLFRRSFG